MTSREVRNIAKALGTATLFAFSMVLLASSLAGGAAPPLGWTTDARVVSVHDGDTVTVEVVKRFNVRLSGVWAPELKDPGGIESRDHLRRLIDGKQVRVRFAGNVDFSKTSTLGRMVGEVWTPEGESVNETQVERGFATREKQR